MKHSRLSDLVNEDQHESTPSEDSVGGDSTPEPRLQEPSPMMTVHQKKKRNSGSCQSIAFARRLKSS